MDKYEFIQNILENKKLNHFQREKVFSLAKSEIISDRAEVLILNSELREKATELETRINNLEKKDNTSNYKSDLNYHSPRSMVQFLFSFSKTEPLKWLTHEDDLMTSNINYLEIINSLKPLYEKNVNFTTRDFVNSFIGKHVSKKNLSIFFPEYKSEYTYGNDDVKKKINDGENPFSIQINNTINFRDEISRFKHAIEFRNDNPTFSFISLFKKFINDNLSIDYLPTYEDSFKEVAGNVSTYIDTNNFFSGLAIILNWLNSYKSNSSDLSIDLLNNAKAYDLVIFHKKSNLSKASTDNKLKGLSGDLETLRKKWFSVVDFCIEADLIDGPFKIECLNAETTMSFINDTIEKNTKIPVLSENKIVKQEGKIGGVKYLIKIYKNN